MNEYCIPFVMVVAVLLLLFVTHFTFQVWNYIQDKFGGTTHCGINRPGSQLLCLPTRGAIVSKLVPGYIHRDFWTTECGFLAWVHVQVPQEHGAVSLWP